MESTLWSTFAERTAIAGRAGPQKNGEKTETMMRRWPPPGWVWNVMVREWKYLGSRLFVVRIFGIPT